MRMIWRAPWLYQDGNFKLLVGCQSRIWHDCIGTLGCNYSGGVRETGSCSHLTVLPFLPTPRGFNRISRRTVPDLDTRIAGAKKLSQTHSFGRFLSSKNLKKFFRRQIFSHAGCREVVSGTVRPPTPQIPEYVRTWRRRPAEPHVVAVTHRGTALTKLTSAKRWVHLEGRVMLGNPESPVDLFAPPHVNGASDRRVTNPPVSPEIPVKRVQQRDPLPRDSGLAPLHGGFSNQPA